MLHERMLSCQSLNGVLVHLIGQFDALYPACATVPLVLLTVRLYHAMLTAFNL
jgi:hypothetical protein